jgi:hypothetical protein
LEQHGILYASFKCGSEEYEKDGRYFNCYDENSITQLMKNLNSLEILETWITNDLCADRQHWQWFNFLTKKI